MKKTMKAIKDKILSRNKKKSNSIVEDKTIDLELTKDFEYLRDMMKTTTKGLSLMMQDYSGVAASAQNNIASRSQYKLDLAKDRQRQIDTYDLQLQDPYVQREMNDRRRIEEERYQYEMRTRYSPSRAMSPDYRYPGPMGSSYYEYEAYNYNSGSRGMSRRDATAIVCPVCTSDRCSWWEHQIMNNTAGQILKDMLTTGFKGERYYERYGASDSRQQQEEYYQRMKARFEAANMPKPEEPVKTEDVDHDVVSTDIKGKPKKQIAFTIKDAEPNQY